MRDRIRIWWRATRPFSFPASIIPVFLGCSIAWVYDGVDIKWIQGILTLVGVVCLHSGANIINDYFDYKNRIDRPGTYGSSGLLTRRIVTPRSLLIAGIGFHAAGTGIGFLLMVTTGFGVLWLGIAGVFLGLMYTAGLELKYRALGDIAVFLAFGLLITLGAYYVQTTWMSWLPVFHAIPLGFLIDGILHGNNIRDISSDRMVDVRTLAGRLGLRFARIYYAAIITSAFISIPVLVVFARLPWPTVLTFLSLPVAVRNIRTVFRSDSIPEEKFASIDAMGAQLQLIFGFLLIAGVVLGKWAG